MPELAAMYAVGVLLSLGLTGLFVFLQARRSNGATARNVRANLRKAGLYWSENQDKILPWNEDAEAIDRKGSRTTILVTGVLLSLLSWAGLLFLGIVMLSYRFLARSRLEKRLFGSELARDPGLTAEAAARLADEATHP